MRLTDNAIATVAMVDISANVRSSPSGRVITTNGIGGRGRDIVSLLSEWAWLFPSHFDRQLFYNFAASS